MSKRSHAPIDPRGGRPGTGLSALSKQRDEAKQEAVRAAVAAGQARLVATLRPAPQK